MTAAETSTTSAPSPGTGSQPAAVDAGSPVETPIRAKRAMPTSPITAADRFMMRLLRIETIDRRALLGAHTAFRRSVVITGIRCTITYLLIPLLVPILSFVGIIAAPLGIALCLYAIINGVVSVRRFFTSGHKGRWLYTGFILVVFVILGFALAADLGRLMELL